MRDNRHGCRREVHTAKIFLREKRGTENVGSTCVVEQGVTLSLDNAVTEALQNGDEFVARNVHSGGLAGCLVLVLSVSAHQRLRCADALTL